MYKIYAMLLCENIKLNATGAGEWRRHVLHRRFDPLHVGHPKCTTIPIK